MSRRINFLVVFFLLSIVICPLTAKSKRTARVVCTSSIAEWNPSSLETLINSCKEETTIVFDADYDYTVDRCIRPTTSITIKGEGKKLRCINRYNYVISLFDVKNVKSFKIESLILDGGSEITSADKMMPKEFFITVKNVDDVSFVNCTFQNIRTDYPNWKVGDEAYTIRVEDYKRFAFKNNVVKNVYCPEFLKVVLPKDNMDKSRVAEICGNTMAFISTSSAIEVRFGRYRINNNTIGVTRGSSINAFGFNSEIVGNNFLGSHNSSAIDLSEQYVLGYASKNIKVKGNYCEYAHDGFLMADHVSNISIINNTYRADFYDETELARYDRIWGETVRSCDCSLRLDHDVSKIKIRSNTFVGSHALAMFNMPGAKSDIKIENNYIKNVESPKRSSLVITQMDKLVVKNNVFINTGRSLSYLGAPQFIVVGPTNSSEASDRYVQNVTIENNTFSFSKSDIKDGYILAHTVYDKQRCNTLSALNHITIRKNKADFNGNILLVSDCFDNAKQGTVCVKRNGFGDGRISGNMMQVSSPEREKYEKVLKSNTIVEKDGEEYYVVLGGRTSQTGVNFEEDGFVHDGDAILRKITE